MGVRARVSTGLVDGGWVPCGVVAICLMRRILVARQLRSRRLVLGGNRWIPRIAEGAVTLMRRPAEALRGTAGGAPAPGGPVTGPGTPGHARGKARSRVSLVAPDLVRLPAVIPGRLP